MILYKVIKYTILDICLENIFKDICKNFNTPIVEYILGKDLKQGMKFKRMEVESKAFWWKDVEMKGSYGNNFGITCSEYISGGKVRTVDTGNIIFINIHPDMRITIYK